MRTTFAVLMVEIVCTCGVPFTMPIRYSPLPEKT